MSESGDMERVMRAAEAAGDKSVVEVLRELRSSGLNNLQDLIQQSISSSQFAARGAQVAENLASLRAAWTFISPDYVYTGGGSGTRLW